MTKPKMTKEEIATMKVRYKALMAAASILRLNADTMRNEKGADMLDEVACALLAIANVGAVTIEADYDDWMKSACEDEDYANNE